MLAGAIAIDSLTFDRKVGVVALLSAPAASPLSGSCAWAVGAARLTRMLGPCCLAAVASDQFDGVLGGDVSATDSIIPAQPQRSPLTG